MWNLSPIIFDELQNMVSQIGRSPEITQLYELLFDRDRWREAIEPYERPIVVSTMFGMIQYSQRHDLDRRVQTSTMCWSDNR
ncbi:hypothetical protein EAI_10670 [Harpegnathos saltator]|uniref:Uncharacterized protein n=1 Tax=Harpegnathos saltator TaxID=610380 RepID=E2BSB3_HARSA|nr:hypothetical protein EAI_10670 [Harpegnathos saltator]